MYCPLYVLHVLLPTRLCTHQIVTKTSNYSRAYTTNVYDENRSDNIHVRFSVPIAVKDSGKMYMRFITLLSVSQEYNTISLYLYRILSFDSCHNYLLCKAMGNCSHWSPIKALTLSERNVQRSLYKLLHMNSRCVWNFNVHAIDCDDD